MTAISEITAGGDGDAAAAYALLRATCRPAIAGRTEPSLVARSGRRTADG